MATIHYRTSNCSGTNLVYACHYIKAAHCQPGQLEPQDTAFEWTELPRHLEIQANSDVIISSIALVDATRHRQLSLKLSTCLAEYLKLVCSCSSSFTRVKRDIFQNTRLLSLSNVSDSYKDEDGLAKSKKGTGLLTDVTLIIFFSILVNISPKQTLFQPDKLCFAYLQAIDLTVAF